MATVQLNSAALTQLFRSPNGPVGLELLRRGSRVQQRAKQLVGYSTDKEEGGPHLRDTIVKRLVEGPRGLTCLVGSSHPIALLHHQGTRPHVIEPSKAKMLRFKVAGGEVVFAVRVNHPGTRPNPYLVNALPAASE